MTVIVQVPRIATGSTPGLVRGNRTLTSGFREIVVVDNINVQGDGIEGELNPPIEAMLVDVDLRAEGQPQPRAVVRSQRVGARISGRITAKVSG